MPISAALRQGSQNQGCNGGESLATCVRFARDLNPIPPALEANVLLLVLLTVKRSQVWFQSKTKCGIRGAKANFFWDYFYFLEGFFWFTRAFSDHNR